MWLEARPSWFAESDRLPSNARRVRRDTEWTSTKTWVTARGRSQWFIFTFRGKIALKNSWPITATLSLKVPSSNTGA